MLIKSVTLDGVNLNFVTPNELTRWRIDNLVTAEPLAVAWILSFSKGDVLIDVGANIGVISVMAASLRCATVYAFEPHSANFSLLRKNIETNNLEKQIIAWPIAISDSNGFGVLHVMDPGAGSANHSFGEAKNFMLHEQKFPNAQNSYSVRIDDLIDIGVLPIPDHVKIDVDGFEYKVIAGMRSCLEKGFVSSILIEINTKLKEHWELVKNIESFGFVYDEEIFISGLRTKGIHAGNGEMILRRLE